MKQSKQEIIILTNIESRSGIINPINRMDLFKIIMGLVKAQMKSGTEKMLNIRRSLI